MNGTLEQVFDGYLDLRWAMNPVEATYEEAEPATLEDEIDRTAALHAVRHEILVLDKERPHERNPGFHLTHALNGIYLLLARTAEDPSQRARALLSRLQAIPKFLETAVGAVTQPDSGFVELARAMIPGGRAL